jgi:pimeloyl-ACP methyl ester carboxylesterase
MKKYLALICMIGVFAISSCEKDSSEPTKEEYDTKLSDYDLEGLWQGYVADVDEDNVIDDSFHPQKSYFLIFNDQSEEEYKLTLGYGGADTIFWKNSIIKKNEFENYSASLIDENTGIHRDIQILGVKGDSLLKVSYKEYEMQNSTIEPDTTLFVKNNNRGQMGIVSMLGKITDEVIFNDNKLTYEFGSGQPVVLVHGFLGSAEGLEDAVDTLKARGFGENHKVYTYEYNYNLTVNEIIAEMKSQFDTEFTDLDPIIIGHSMGAFVTRAFILNGGGFNKFVSLAGPLDGVYIYDAPINKGLLDFLFTNGSMDMVSGSDYMNELNSIDESSYIENYYLISSQMKGKWMQTPHIYWQWNHEYIGEFSFLGPALTNCLIEKDLPQENDGFISNYSSDLMRIYDKSKSGEDGQPNWIDLDIDVEHYQLIMPDECPEVFNWIINNL